MGLDAGQSFADALGRPISIHEARMGLDSNLGLFSSQLAYFNPRGPHGPRRYLLMDTARH